MSAFHWAQVLTALVMLANVVLWARLAAGGQHPWHLFAWPPLTWCAHSLMFFVALFILRAANGGALTADQALHFNMWSTAIRLHGGLSCLFLLWVLWDWQHERR